MGLRIATNIASQQVQKNLKEVSGEGNASLEKLSSGKRITKASDDAAGLAIATNLEAQTKGLRQASRNANDGISLVQTAEGGLNETTNILTRLRELTIQAASDTVGESERGFLDKEYQQLNTEIDRISESTVFNGTQLLNGEGRGNQDSARSVIQDVDVAEASADLASTTVVKNAAVSTLAQANQIPNSALRLIG